eukprot:scaffold9191_cov114-Cylindrotheca_fusiformis.AAC.30
MPSSFDRYSSDFRDLIRQIEQRFHSESDASDLVKQCKDLILQMKMEARDTRNGSTKQERLDVLKACKMQLESYSIINEKKELFFAAENQTKRMGNQQDQLAEQNKRLQNALQSLNETEEVGTEMGKELDKNREKIENTQANVNRLSALTGRANNMLTSMIRRSKRWF